MNPRISLIGELTICDAAKDRDGWVNQLKLQAPECKHDLCFNRWETEPYMYKPVNLVVGCDPGNIQIGGLTGPGSPSMWAKVPMSVYLRHEHRKR